MLSGMLPAVAVAVFVALISQMLRTDGRADLVPSTAFAITLGVFAAVSAGWIGAAQSLGAPEVIAIGAAGLGAGVVAWAVPFDRWVCGSAAVVLGGAAGAAVAVGVDSVVTWVLGVAIGSGTALFAVLGEVLGRAWSQGRTHASAGWGFPGAMSIVLAAPIVYVGGQLVGAPGL
jgi:Tfp pilus assembly protein PilW